MSDWSMRGKVHLVEPTKTYGQNGFRKRLVVLEQDNGRFTNHIPVEFLKNACDSVDELKPGDEIEVSFRINGRKWQRDAGSEAKYFVSIEALRFDLVGAKTRAASGRSSEPTGSYPDESEAPADDDVPF
ncbi:MAG: DUF3127 domain-containing protein [Planctomycetes bacterium]|nr:DUF3127 domain-containing protein [Planctomycetota bacterium]